MRALRTISLTLMTTLVAAASSLAFAAEGADWTISKSSGDVWRAGTEVQQVALKQDDILKAGDTIRTGRNGRVLLKRGEETMLVAPNSVVGLPAEKKEGISTTIVQQAGSILLDVERRNVKHFEVETPYAVAVVKGTQFRVTVEAGKTQVDVSRGQVEVASFKSGQIAQVIAGQHATAFAYGKTGLSLGGSGAFSPIEQGKPRASTIERIPVPRNGFTAPRQAANERGVQLTRQSSGHAVRPGGNRISSPIGDVRLNVQRVTNGLMRDNSAAPSGGRTNSAKNEALAGGADSSAGNSNQGLSSSSGAGNSSSSGNTGGSGNISATIAASSGADGGPKGKDKDKDNKGNGNGGANGSGKPKGHGPGNGNNGNGNGNNGNGNNGNGNGNGGNGNGNGNGNGRGRN